MQRRLTAVPMILLLCLLTGCSGTQTKQIQAGLTLRTSVLEAGGCQFSAQITADDGEAVFSTAMDCEYDCENVAFILTAPDTLSGISGTVRGKDLEIGYDGVSLVMPLAEDAAPAALAPALLCQAITGGYLASAGKDSGMTLLTYTLESAQNVFTVQLWLEGEQPVHCQISREAAVILTLEISDFTCKKGT